MRTNGATLIGFCRGRRYWSRLVGGRCCPLDFARQIANLDTKNFDEMVPRPGI